jgi:hypothetical protein
MPIPIFTTEQLYLTADQLIRRAGGPDSASAQQIGNYLYDHARPDTRGSRQEYTKIASDAIRQAVIAQDMEKNLDQVRRRLAPSSGIPDSEGQYSFRVIVVALDSSGTEIFSTAVTVRSNDPLSGRQVKDMAIMSMAQMPSNYEQDVRGKHIASFDTYIMLAGQR